MIHPDAGKVTASALAKVLRRNADGSLISTPEGKLIFAVIEQAIKDADQGYREARAFFNGDRLNICTLVGLQPIFVRETIRRVRDWMRG